MKLLSLSKFADYDKNNTHYIVEIMRIRNVKNIHKERSCFYAGYNYSRSW